MTRLLEFLVALVIVAVLAVVAAVVMPSSGHVERSLVVSKDIRQVYDLFAGFRRFPDYSAQITLDPKTAYTFAGKPYGQGAQVTWKSEEKGVGDGSLEVASLTPTFDKIDDAAKGTIVWNLKNNWSGSDKHFTINLEKSGRGGKLTKITWAYDVSYGWNLFDRYSNLYIHGAPDSMIQFSLGRLQNLLAGIPSGDYSKLFPEIVDTQPTPVLFISSSSPRQLADLDSALDDATKTLQAAAKKLNVQVSGPRITFTTNYGDQKYTFDVALPISSATLNVGGQSIELTAASRPKMANPANAASAADAPTADGSVSTTPGSKDRFGNVIIDDTVRATLAFGGKALKGEWNGNPAGVPVVRLQLKQYAATHGYASDDNTNRIYDIQVKGPTTDGKGTVTGYDEQQYEVYLPLSGDVPAQTPEQEAGMKNPGLQDAPAASGTAADPAASSTAPGDSAPTPASTVH